MIAYKTFLQRPKQIFVWGILGFLVIFLFSCMQSSTLDSDHTNSQVYSAAVYKAKECGSTLPQDYLFVTSNKVPQRNVDLCTYAIMRMNCPFDGFPLVCVLLYIEEVGEFPKYLQFRDIINEKL